MVDKTGVSDTDPNAASGDPVVKQKTEDTVPYASHLKLLAQRKTDQEELNTLKDWKKEQEQKKQEEDGNYKDVITSLREELATVKTETSETKKKIAFSKFSSQIADVAKESGCVDTETLIALLNKKQMASVQVDDDMNANKEDMARLVGELKESKPYMFGATNVNHTPLNVGGFKKTEVKTVAAMTKEEIAAQLRSGNFKED